MPEFFADYAVSQQLKVTIKVTRCHGSVTTEQGGRIVVDRNTITYDKLRKHLINTYKIKSPFLIMYQTPKTDGLMAIVDDWDLDAALQQSRNSLRVTVHCSQHDADASFPRDFDILTIGDMPPPVHDDDTSLVKRKNSLMRRLLHKLNRLVFSKREPEPLIREESTTQTSKSPMTLKEFQTFLDGEGRMVNRQAFTDSIFRGGISPKLRKVAWRHLLNIFPEGMTGKERVEYLKKKSHEYTELKNKWKTEYKATEGQLSEELRFVTTMVKKDVIRTDRTHPYYKGSDDNKHILSLFDLLCTYALNHPDVSYCQGMCDYASPLLFIQDNEAHAYLLFCALMERVRYNFYYDGKAISTKFDHLTQLLSYFDKEFYTYMQDNQVDDLLFAYRWILLEMRREFPFDESLLFTEVMWSTVPIVPRRTDVPLYLKPDTSTAQCSNPYMTVSPYAKLNTLEDSDSVSQYSYDETRSCCCSEEECLSIDRTICDREICINQALHSSDNEICSVSDELPTGSMTLISEPMCRCVLEPNSTFYVELDKMDYSFLTEEEQFDELDEAVKCQCTKSIDSGYLSRANSPTKQLELVIPNPLDEGDEAPNVFPPPSEFGYGNPFVLFAALMLILNHRDTIMDQKMDFNDILMLFNGAMRKNDVTNVLKDSRVLYEAYAQNNLHIDVDEFEHICI